MSSKAQDGSVLNSTLAVANKPNRSGDVLAQQAMNLAMVDNGRISKQSAMAAQGVLCNG
jgi:hypothetical protein